MKKFTAFALALVMALGLLAGCGSSNSDNNSTPAGDDASDAAKTKLVVATSPDFPPFESLEGGEVVGIEVDILNKIAEKMDMELDIQQMDFDSVIPGVQAGKFDVGMSGITVTDKRKENVDFSSVYFMAAQAIVVADGSSITGKADLEGKKVSVQTGTTAEEYCMANGYEVLAFTANNDAAAALTAGKVDAWVVDNEVALALRLRPAEGQRSAGSLQRGPGRPALRRHHRADLPAVRRDVHRTLTIRQRSIHRAS